MLTVSKLKRAYGDFIAADAVEFSIAKGEIVGLLGHNGAGKTTVMKMLSGYLEPSGGQILFEGKRLADHLKTLQQKIGYLPESLPVYPELSVGEYLDYAAELKGLRGSEKQQEIKRVINATDIAAKLLAPIATLSRGYKQRGVIDVRDLHYYLSLILIFLALIPSHWSASAGQQQVVNSIIKVGACSFHSMNRAANYQRGYNALSA